MATLPFSCVVTPAQLTHCLRDRSHPFRRFLEQFLVYKGLSHH